MKKVILLMATILAFQYAFAQDIPVEPGFLEKLMMFLLEKFPKIAPVVFVIGLLRLFFKPLTMAYEMYVKFTPGKEDDVKWGKAKQSKAFMLIEKILDFFASIKLPGGKK